MPSTRILRSPILALMSIVIGWALLWSSAWADSSGIACSDQQSAYSDFQQISDFAHKTVFVITDQAIKGAASTVLATRCEEHQNWWTNLTSDICSEASEDLIHDLDCPMMKGRPCFIHEFEKLANSTEVDGYMRDLMTQLSYDRAAPPDQPFNLWKWTLARAGGDPKKALLWIAVIFQDPGSKIIMDYFFRHPSQKPRYISDFDVLLGTFNQLIRSPTPWLQLLPRNIAVKGVGPYHFYATAYLASRLKGQLPSRSGRKMALALPTMFNASYEYIYAHLDKRDPSSRFDRIISELEDSKEPASLNSSDPGQSHAIDASYEGYAGAAWGAGIPTNKLMNLEEFRKRFATSPHQFFDDLLK